MNPRKELTAWQRRHKLLLEEALLNPDIYQELGYIRRDTNSSLQVADAAATLDEKVLRLMNKYGVPSDCFYVLREFCKQGGEFDFFLIPKRKPNSIKPNAKLHPAAKHYREAYDLWIQQLKSITEITEILKARGHPVDVQYVSKIIKRMNAKDPNRDQSYGLAPGRRRPHTKV
jgi:hypothetical protein